MSERAIVLLLFTAVIGCDSSMEHKIKISSIPYRASISSDGNTLYYVSSKSGQRELYIASLQTPSIGERIELEGGLKGWPFIAADSGSLLFTLQSTDRDPGNICVLDFDSGVVRQVTQSNKFDAAPAFNADSSQIVFIRANQLRDYSLGGKVWDAWDLYIIDADGTNERRLTSKAFDIVSAPYFLDSNTIVFAAGESTSSMRLLTVQIADAPASSSATRVDSTLSEVAEKHQSDPCPTANGERLAAILRDQNGYDYEVWRMNVGQNMLHSVTANGFPTCCPIWYPDGKTLLFLADPDQDGRFEIRRIATDGTNEIVLLKESALY